MTALTKRPADASATTNAVLDALQGLTMFPWAMLKTQAERHGKDPAQLAPGDVAVLVDDIVMGLERFTSPEKAALAREALAKASGEAERRD